MAKTQKTNKPRIYILHNFNVYNNSTVICILNILV